MWLNSGKQVATSAASCMICRERAFGVGGLKNAERMLLWLTLINTAYSVVVS